MFVLCVMVEPTRTDARIRFARHPRVACLQSVMQHRPCHLAIVVQQTPIGFAYVASLCTHPAQIATVAAVIPNQTVGLQFANHLVGLRPLVVGCAVYLARFVCSTIPAIATVGTIKPHFEDVAILCKQLAQLIAEVSHIFLSAVFWVVSVPRR